MKRGKDTADIDANIADTDAELEDESLKSSFYIKKRPHKRSLYC